MKNLTFIFALAFLFFSCERVEKCYEEYTISGRLVDDNPDSVSSNGGLSDVLIEITHPLRRDLLSSKNRERLIAEVKTDENGYFSTTYECVYLTKENVNLRMLNRFSMNGYVLPKNQNVYTILTQIPFARIFCEINNQSSFDTLYLNANAITVFDSGSIEGIESTRYLAIPIKGKENIRIGYTTNLSGDLTDPENRKLNVHYSNKMEDLDDNKYLGHFSIISKGAPSFDEVNIALK